LTTWGIAGLLGSLVGGLVAGFAAHELGRRAHEVATGERCNLFSACFAAGTPLRTPDGSKPIEAFVPGDLVLSRDEARPDGAVEAKVVEEVFVKTGRVLHLHVGGQVIETTPEHPFYAYDKGWVPAMTLAAGDRLLGEDGSWIPVEEGFDTGEYAPVYNLRVADWHTYFVGEETWGFAAWAHNAECTITKNEQTGKFEVRDAEGKVYSFYERSTAEAFANVNGWTVRSAPKVEAVFEHNGRTYRDMNPTHRDPSLATGEPIPTASQSGNRRPYNNDTIDMHGEIGAMFQSYKDGNRGGTATLTITGEPICSRCKGDIKRMAQALELAELTVIHPEGIVQFIGSRDFAVVKKGGRGYR
jgi:hypothetical protein